MKVCLDPGHGGRDPGAVADGVREADLNLSIASRIMQEIELAGDLQGNGWHGVIMTRWKDRALSLTSRANFANRYAADCFVSVHCNAAASPQPAGFEVFYFAGSVGGQKLAHTIREHFLRMDGPKPIDRGIKTANFTVLRKTLMPAVLVECGFITNPAELAWLRDLQNQYRLAAALAGGIGRWCDEELHMRRSI